MEWPFHSYHDVFVHKCLFYVHIHMLMQRGRIHGLIQLAINRWVILYYLPSFVWTEVKPSPAVLLLHPPIFFSQLPWSCLPTGAAPCLLGRNQSTLTAGIFFSCFGEQSPVEVLMGPKQTQTRHATINVLKVENQSERSQRTIRPNRKSASTGSNRDREEQ